MVNTSGAFDVRTISCLPLRQIAGPWRLGWDWTPTIDLCMTNNGAEPMVLGEVCLLAWVFIFPVRLERNESSFEDTSLSYSDDITLKVIFSSVDIYKITAVKWSDPLFIVFLPD